MAQTVWQPVVYASYYCYKLLLLTVDAALHQVWWGGEYGRSQVAFIEDSKKDTSRNSVRHFCTLCDRKCPCETHCCLLIHLTVNSEILQGTVAFITLKDSSALHSVWTQLTFCNCAIDQYYCYCQLTEYLLKNCVYVKMWNGSVMPIRSRTWPTSKLI